jgi:hypothetical protein
VPHAHLFRSEQSSGSQPAVAAPQIESLPDMRNLLQVERFILPSPPSSPIQNFRDLAITVMIQQPVDFGDHFRFSEADNHNLPSAAVVLNQTINPDFSHREWKRPRG